MGARWGSSISTTSCARALPDLPFQPDLTYMSAMNTRPNKRLLNSEDRLDMGAAKASFGSMPSWQRLAIWFGWLALAENMRLGPLHEDQRALFHPNPLPQEGIGRCRHWHIGARRKVDLDELERRVRHRRDVASKIAALRVAPYWLILAP